MTESTLLADAVERFFSERCLPDFVAAAEAGSDTTELWTETEQLGLTLVSVSEDTGGEGGSLADAMTVLRAAGRHAVPLPIAETILAGWLLSEAGLPVGLGPATIAPAQPSDHLLLTTRGGGLRITGSALRIPWGCAARRIVVVAPDEADRLHVASVDPAGARVVQGMSLANEPRDYVDFTDVPVEPSACAPVLLSPDTIQVRGALFRTGMMLGALERARDLAVEHVKVRQQFGRPLARFQAVQQLIAQIARDVAVTRAAVDLAVVAVTDDPGAAWLEVAAAKVVAGQAARGVAARAHQVHGAIGVTKEYPLSMLTRRLWSWRNEFGSEAEWSQRIGAEAWQTDGGPWALATSGRMAV
jgi:acyl-CoA dehydrogenase